MKYRKSLAAMLLLPGILLVLLFYACLPVSASDGEDELVSNLQKSVNPTVFYEKETERTIICFDVREDGSFAIGCDNKTIYLYDSLGNFQYGYRLYITGAYSFALNGNNIIVYLARGDIALEIDPTGKCVSAKEVRVPYDILYQEYKQIGDTRYSVEGDIDLAHPSRLIKTDADGTRTVLYDATTMGYIEGVFVYVILSLIPLWLVLIYRQKVKEEDESQDKDDAT